MVALALWAALQLSCEPAEESPGGAPLPTVTESLTVWAGPDVYVRADQPVTFQAHFTGKVVRVQWDFDDDGTMDSTLNWYDGALDSATHTYKNPGTYGVLLRVADGNGFTAEARRKVVVLDSGSGAVLGRFGPYFNLTGEVKPAVAAYALDPAKAANLSRYPSLTSQHKARLAQDGFAVQATSRDQMHAIYTDALAGRQALFITSDSVLYAFQALHDAALRRCEEDHLAGALRRMVDALLARTDWQREQAASAEVRVGLRKNLAFLGVASTLLGRPYDLPSDVSSAAQAELSLINGHKGHAVSPLFGYKEDYSQYRPRGHYVRGEASRRYFQAMTWLSRMTFRISPPTEEGGGAQGRVETIRGMLLAQALYTTPAGETPASALWEQIHEPSAFLAGGADDITPRDYAMLMAKIHGHTWRVMSPNELANPGKVGVLMDQAKKLRDLQSSAFAWQIQQSKDQPYTRGMRLLGRRFLPDSYVLRQLVYPALSEPKPGKRRTLPRGLDVMAALGSQRALDVLDKFYLANAYPGFTSQVGKLRAALASLTSYDRVQSLPWAWLDALAPMMDVPGAGYPAFMRTSEWRDKQLNAALGAWTGARHHAAPQQTKQSAPPAPGSPVVPVVYVEPAPRVYARLYAMARMLRLGLEAYGQRDADVSSRLMALEILLTRLHQYSLLELEGKDLTVTQMDTLRDYGKQLQKLINFSAVDQGPWRMSQVVTLASDTTGQARQEAVGDPMDIHVLVPHDGEVVLARGAIFSYYELTRGAGEHLTDASWQTLLASKAAGPAPPGWIFQ